MTTPRDERLHRLDVLVGRWATTITMLNPDGTNGEISAAADIYRWTSNSHFLLHDVDAEMGGQRMQSMEVIALDPHGDGFVTQSYDADGSINDFTTRIEGRSWRIDGQVQRFSGEFSEDRQIISGQWEQREAEQWLPLMTVRLVKQVT